MWEVLADSVQSSAQAHSSAQAEPTEESKEQPTQSVSFITIKLNSSNYFAWKSQIKNALKVNHLFSYLDGSVVIPASEIQDASGTKIPNPEFFKWQNVDRMVLLCIMATLTPSILPHVVGSNDTFQVWAKLEAKYSALSQTHILDLKKRLYSLKQTTSMDKHLDFVKELVQKLEASGSHMNESEVVFHTVNGLSEDYLSLKQTIRTQCATTPLSFSAVSAMLMSEELCLAHTPDPASTVLLVQHHNVSMASSSSTPSSSVNHSITPPLPQPSTQQGGFQYPV
ncbi:hypothetical protein RHSIM_Rhsim04G0020900 [Rhododendron simsii]|uniref:Retrotransposon Copia-like N-terminal domain-containing protein n=1 Tax=Rhododendron simsii TaxID=118357 RepID=A0A834LR98_RHOSS|nr:hypothetical protein RHSIM_Rhsim04G0020900 [Rhododendron simsii]